MPTQSGHTTAIRARKVIGTNVKDGAGQKVGEVEDIVLDKESNQIMFAIVGFGGSPNAARFAARNICAARASPAGRDATSRPSGSSCAGCGRRRTG